MSEQGNIMNENHELVEETPQIEVPEKLKNQYQQKNYNS